MTTNRFTIPTSFIDLAGGSWGTPAAELVVRRFSILQNSTLGTRGK
jgi:hypothetical protein